MSWHDEYFDEKYIEFYQGIITPTRTALEVDFLISLFNTDTKKILDIPCGFGRHSIELAKRGYEVVGVDAYESQLRVAKENARNIENVSFTQADLRNIAYTGFDATIHMFSSFGYFSRKEDTLVMQNLVHSVKQDDGIIVIDVRNPVRFCKEMSEHGWRTERTTDTSTEIEEFDPITSVQTLTYSRGALTKTAKLNVYQPEEYFAMLREYGCAINGLYGDFKGGEYIPVESRRLIIVAKR